MRNATGDINIMNQTSIISEDMRRGRAVRANRHPRNTAPAFGAVTGQQGEIDVVIDTLETNVICISPGLNDTWDISEKGGEQPIASFDEKEDAYAYASYLRTVQPGVTVLVEDDEGFSPLPAEDEHRYTRNGARRSTRSVS